jgi:branched-chain amino acid transport system substrate-binding protein
MNRGWRSVVPPGLMAAVIVVGAWCAVAEAQAPVKVGLLAPLTGPFAALGRDLVAGTELYLDEIGRQAAGRRIELIVEDEQANPAMALTKARKLVEQDRVHLLTGGVLASIGYALHPYVESVKMPTTYPVMAPDDLTQRTRSNWVVRTGFSASQPLHPFGEWVARTLGYKRVVAIGMDYAFGWEIVGGFQRTFEESGGQIVQKIWTPLPTVDFAPFLAQIRRDADAVFALMAGRPALQFVKQYQDAGLKGRLPLIGAGTVTDESVLPAMGDEAVGIVTANFYSNALDTPANRKFAAAFEQKAGRIASHGAELSYTNARWIVEAVKAIGGKVEDREALLGALRKVEIKDAPRGPLTVDAYGNPIQNIYVRRVERVGGKLQNTVLHTFPAVSQFWKYPPEEYLKLPLYTRDYPPCRFC